MRSSDELLVGPVAHAVTTFAVDFALAQSGAEVLPRGTLDGQKRASGVERLGEVLERAQVIASDEAPQSYILFIINVFI